MKAKKLGRASPEALSAYLLEHAKRRGEGQAGRLEKGVLEAVRALVSDKRLHELQRESALLAIVQDYRAEPAERKSGPPPTAQWRRIARQARALIEALEALPEEHALERRLWVDVPRVAELAEMIVRNDATLRERESELKHWKAKAGVDGPGTHAKPGTKLALRLDGILACGASLGMEVIPPAERRRLIRPVLEALDEPISDETLRQRLLLHADPKRSRLTRRRV